ncbi:MAG: methyltransferase domain-containing protein [Candidatus Delongbacteria bacterium]|nr:methyltransferase domain-containing protein [Candidatus Delongbacteria bacterium]
MRKLKLLNLGCGYKFHEGWINIDFVSESPFVFKYNLLKGIPYPDNYFDAVYHSQVLEHFQKKEASKFINECYRVLKPGGVIRVVVPDLENIASEYLRLVKENIENLTDSSKADYEWIMLEMYDQTIRNKSGGEMSEFLKKPDIINKDFIEKRIGYYDKKKRDSLLSKNTPSRRSLVSKLLKKTGLILKSIFSTEKSRIGELRTSGEIHYWMYDRYSLSVMLKETGFKDVKVKDPFSSSIPNWENYELDVKEGRVFDPSALFMEAVKP